jgi:hypothetical protein
MALTKKFVLEGTKDDLVAHLRERLREEVDASLPEAKGTGKEKYAHETAANVLEWAIEQVEAWVEVPDDGEGAPASNGDATSDRRAAAAASAD